MSDNSIYEIIAGKIKRDQEELNAAEKVTKKVYPIISELVKREIVNPVILKIKLSEVDPKYRDVLFGLYRIAIDGGPEGSYIILDTNKVLFIIDDIDGDYDGDDSDDDPNYITDRKGKKSIVGITAKIITAIKSLVVHEMAALCHLVNDSVLKKVINAPSYSITSTKVQAVAKSDKSQQR